MKARSVPALNGTGYLSRWVEADENEPEQSEKMLCPYQHLKAARDEGQQEVGHVPEVKMSPHVPDLPPRGR